MHIFFRTDGNEVIATGHVMRCLSIADECRKSGNEVTFITADDYCNEMLCKRNYESINIHGKWNDLGFELDMLSSLIKRQSISILVIDSYYVNESYLRYLKSITKVVYIDDLNAFHYPVDVLINYSIYAQLFEYQKRYKETELLLGCEYAPLRRQFQRAYPKKIYSHVNNILITTGGTDRQNITGKLVSYLTQDKEFEGIAICLVVGMYNSHIDELKKIEQSRSNVKICINVDNVAELMAEADIAVSAGGSTLYELGACGVPTIMFSFANNQSNNVQEFSRQGLMEYAGDIREGEEKCISTIIQKIKELAWNKERRVKYSSRLQQLIDGYGSERIAKFIVR